MLRSLLIVWKKSLMVQAVVNDGHPIPINAVKPYDVASGALADGNDSVLPPRQLLGNRPAIKHPRPVVFARQAEPFRKELLEQA
jgi:hypothetical protein